jgi:transcriptional regulator with PAS, ATPase and Fis domain
MPSAEYNQLVYFSEKENECAVRVIQSWIRSNLILTQGNHPFRTLTRQFAKLVVREALVQASGNKSKAARLLGIARPTLAKKIHQFGCPTASGGQTGPFDV